MSIWIHQHYKLIFTNLISLFKQAESHLKNNDLNDDNY